MKILDHLLLCEVACALLNDVFSRIELLWVMPLLVGGGLLVAFSLQ
jgi:hypothetical protein